MSREEFIDKVIIKSFPGIKMKEQYFVLGKRTDLYLPDHKLVIEFDGKGHMGRKNEKEEK